MNAERIDKIKKILLGIKWQLKYLSFALLHRSEKISQMPNRVIFFSKCRSGCLIMRGEAIANELKKMGVETLVAEKKLPKDLSNKDIILFIKDLHYKDLVFAKRRGAKIIYDIEDSFFYPFHLTFEPYFCDGILFPNEKMLSDYKKKTEKAICTSIYHNWDPRFKGVESPRGKRAFNIGYFGIFPEKNAINYKELHVVDLGHDFEKHLRTGKRYPFHYSCRDNKDKEFKYKPHTKIATASICNSILITSKDFSSVEILGENYPFYLTNNLDDDIKMINKMKKSYNRGELAIWFDKMKKISELLSPNSVAKQYLNYLKKFNLEIKYE